ncbi:MAG TPA: thioredoxin family protein [Flavisolibacter sp.]|nr:thioredoxin family protein [Flavisolibacter sp.]
MLRLILAIQVFIFLSVPVLAQNAAPVADAILKESFQLAAKENKNVIIIFHASWCVWCHKMDSSINDPSCREFFQKNYIIRHLTVYESAKNKQLENPGALEILTQYHGNDQGIPFWIVFDKNGKQIGNSLLATGNNSGCPAKVEEVDHLIDVLKRSSSISANEEEAVRKRFRRNDL